MKFDGTAGWCGDGSRLRCETSKLFCTNGRPMHATQDTLQEGAMDVLVMLEEHPDHSPVLAHVNSVSAPLVSNRPARDIVTLYGVPSPELLALALAAAVESLRSGEGHEYPNAIRHLGVWAER